MQKLSSVNEARKFFVFNGHDISFDFKDIIEKAWSSSTYRKGIINRSKSYRNSELFSRFLKKVYAGDLPKDINRLLQVLKYDQLTRDLFYMSEEGFKNYYPEYYNSLYNDLSENEKLGVFWKCDCGGRSVIELQQDVIAGNIYEDMLVHHSNGNLVANEKASGRGTSKVSTLCDLVFKSPKREGYPYVEANVEVKTKFGKEIKDTIEFRGSADKIINSNGLVLCVYPMLSKAILVDMMKEKNITRTIMKSGKPCDTIKVNPDDFFDFKCWERGDMTKLLHMIYDMRRETR